MFKLIRQFLYIWKESMFHPGRFFRQIPEKEPIGKSLAYSLAVKLIVIAGIILFTWAWEFYYPSAHKENESSFLSLLKPGVVSFLMGLVVFASFDIIGRFVFSGILHFLLLMFRSGQKGFKATFRIVSYSESSYVFYLTYIGIVWGLIIMAVGLKQTHQTPVWKSIVVLILAYAVYLAVIALAMHYLFYIILTQFSTIDIGGGQGGGRRR